MIVLECSHFERYCCYEISPSGKRILRKCSPHRNPEVWFFINAIVLIWSIKLMCFIVDNNDNDKTPVQLEYLIYIFGTCVVWALEVGLKIFDYIDSKKEDMECSLLHQPTQSITDANETKPLWIELTLAIYFVIDSARVVGHLSKKEIHKLSKGMLYNVVLNMLAYLYLVYQQFIDWSKSNLDQTLRTDLHEII